MKLESENSASRGELVYIPSQTFLSDQLDVKRTSKLQKMEEPGIFLVLESGPATYKIFYKGSDWYVAKKDVYEVRGEVK